MIYISGRITGNKNWQEDFQKAEDYLLKLGFSKYEIKNPLNLDKESKEIWGDNPTYVQYMIHDIHELIFCTDIYMLRGWWRSKGARLERHIAKVLGLGIVYQKRGDKMISVLKFICCLCFCALCLLIIAYCAVGIIYAISLIWNIFKGEF